MNITVEILGGKKEKNRRPLMWWKLRLESIDTPPSIGDGEVDHLHHEQLLT